MSRTRIAIGDKPYRLKEIAALRGVIFDVARDPDLSPEERDGVSMAQLELNDQDRDIRDGQAAGDLPANAAAYTVASTYADNLDELRRSDRLLPGESSGVSQVWAAVEARLLTLAEAEDEADYRENLLHQPTEPPKRADGALPWFASAIRWLMGVAP